MNPRRNHGLSLIELLVAIGLGALLLGGATTLFVNNRATYNITHDMARMQENARFALETMVRDLRMAGYVGCFTGIGTNEFKNLTGASGGELWDVTLAIEGFDSDMGANQWQPSGQSGATAPDTDLVVAQFGVPASGGDPAIPTDAITVRYLDGHRDDADADDIPDLQLVNEVHGGATALALNNLDLTTAGIKTGQPVALSDCGSTDLFLVSNDPATAGFVNATTLSRTFDPTSEALFAPLVGVRYFVRLNPDGVPSLYRATIDIAAGAPVERADELIDGVDTLQILYGIDANNDDVIDSYVPGDLVGANWGTIAAVRFALLMRTVDEYGADTNPENRFQVADKVFCNADRVDADCDVSLPDDRRSRRVYQTTVRVRNF